MQAEEALKRLKAANWLKAPETRRILGALDGQQGRTRAVGGIVRDTLLGRDTARRDIDVATELTPEEVTARAKAQEIAAYPTGVEHGTVTLRVGKVTAEVTTLREDIETDGRHAVVRFGTDWARDAERRDFTMNALYADMDGALFDPLDGLGDCLARRVRFIGDADRRIAEDRLRVYRFFRFSASHADQRFDADGYAACTRAAGTLDALSAERVGEEMRRMLSLPRVAETLAAMQRGGILGEDVCPHGLIERLSAYEELADPPSLAGRLTLMMAGGRAKVLQKLWRLSNAEVALAQRVGSAAELLGQGQAGEAVYRYPHAVGDAVPVFAATAAMSREDVVKLRGHVAALRVPPFPVSGNDLIAKGILPGPELGRVLSRLERSWIDSGFTLDRSELLADLKE